MFLSHKVCFRLKHFKRIKTYIFFFIPTNLVHFFTGYFHFFKCTVKLDFAQNH